MVEKEKHPLASYPVVKTIMESLTRVSDDIRWMGIGAPLYTNLGSAALRGYIASELIYAAENEGTTVSKYLVAKDLLKNNFKKSLGEVRRDVVHGICDELSVGMELFDVIIPYTHFRERAGVDAANELFLNKGIREEQLVKVASAIAKLVELNELKYKLTVEEYSRISRETLNVLEEYKKEGIPGLEVCTSDASIYRYLEISKALRAQSRWKLQATLKKVSVLEHSFVTATIAFFNCLELMNDEEEAGKCFFFGIVHDLAEAWTGDIPSPLKDKKVEDLIKSYFYMHSIGDACEIESLFDVIDTLSNEEKKCCIRNYAAQKGHKPTEKDLLNDLVRILGSGLSIRSGVEAVEELALQRNLYDQLPDFMVSKVREHMYEEEVNKDYFPIIKAADYISAAWECWLQYLYGTNDPYFLRPILNMKEWAEKGKYAVSNSLKELVDYFCKEANNIVRSATNSSSLDLMNEVVQHIMMFFT